MAPAVDTTTDYNLLLNIFKQLKIYYVLATVDKHLVIQLDSIIEFHFNFAGNFLSYNVPLS